MIAVSDSERENNLSEEQLALLRVMRGIAKSVVPTDRIKMSPVVQANGRLARLEAKARRKERRALKKQARENVQSDTVCFDSHIRSQTYLPHVVNSGRFPNGVCARGVSVMFLMVGGSCRS
jgi:hypothetical protein